MPKAKQLLVAQVVVTKAFLEGKVGFEYTRTWQENIYKSKGAGDIRQVSTAKDENGYLFAIMRERDRYSSVETDPWPDWVITRGDSFSKMGTSGQWHPNIQDLGQPCKLIKNDLPVVGVNARRYDKRR